MLSASTGIGLNTILAIKGMLSTLAVILTCIGWYAAFPLSYRKLATIMLERCVLLDLSLINHRAIELLPVLEEVFHLDKHRA